MRVAVQYVTCFGNAHQLQHAQGFSTGGSGALALVNLNRFSNLVAGGEHRVERGHRLLKDHRYVGPANAAQRLLTRLRQVQHFTAATPKGHAAVDNAAAAMLNQAHQCQRGD